MHGKSNSLPNCCLLELAVSLFLWLGQFCSAFWWFLVGKIIIRWCHKPTSEIVCFPGWDFSKEA